MATATAAVSKPGALNPLRSCLKKELSLFDSASYRFKFRDYRFSQFNTTLKKQARNAAVIPTIRSQRSPDYFPDAKFYKVEAILRPWRVSKVSSALLKIGIRGVTVSDVKGFGAQGGSKERQGGSEFFEDKFVAKVKMEIVVSKDQVKMLNELEVEDVIDKIIEESRTGEIGDGKIFLVPISDVIRVRTVERGELAERMTGGRHDMGTSTA